jgi:hypothetical protein
VLLQMSVGHGSILLNQTKGQLMEQFKVACLRYEICGAQETFYSAEEYEIYGDDYICAECFDLEEMTFFELIGWADSDALASAGHGMDEDY